MKKYFPSMSGGSLSDDLTAGLLVSLVALPLSMGIALASGFPPSSGLIAAIIGGIVTSLAGGARFTVKGPAAGLIVIVIGAVADLADPSDPMSGAKRAAAVVVMAGGIQLVLGLCRCGILAELMPISVIHGMLAAIGLIIIGKQLPIVCGVTPTGKTPSELLLEIPHNFLAANPEILMIGLLAFITMQAYPKLKFSITKKIPAVLCVMVGSIVLGTYLHLGDPHSYELLGKSYYVGPNYLVHLPPSVASAIFMPDWSQALTLSSIKWVLFFVLVGSIESLLTVSAVDSLNPARERANCNRDLMTLGLGNMVSGLLGGLPMISEIVRSKANIDAGAKSGWSNFFHGVLVLAYLTLLGPVLERVPVAALAGILVYVGLRLASPKEFMHAWEAGKEQFAFFAITCFFTIVEDLLVGIGAGLLAAVAYQVLKGATPKTLLTPDLRLIRNGDELLISIHGSASFSNFHVLRAVIERASDTWKMVSVDLSCAKIVDHGFLEKLDALSKELVTVTVKRAGLERHRPLSKHPNATHVLPRGYTPSTISGPHGQA